jgi:hypothetical protein
MSDLFFKIVNPIVKTLLRSPLHRAMSHNTVLLEFTGHKSGRSLSTPVSYVMNGDEVQCFTSFPWWRNLRQGNEITLILQGKRRKGIPSVTVNEPAAIARALKPFLVAVPRDAPHAEVALDATGQPNSADIERAAQRLVLVTIRLTD